MTCCAIHPQYSVVIRQRVLSHEQKSRAITGSGVQSRFLSLPRLNSAGLVNVRERDSIDFIFFIIFTLSNRSHYSTIHRDRASRKSYDYSLALACSLPAFTRVTAAAFNTVVPRSLTFVSVLRRHCQYLCPGLAPFTIMGLPNITLSPFFHISVINVSPG